MKEYSTAQLVEFLRRKLTDTNAPIGNHWGVFITTDLCKAVADRLSAYEATGLIPEEIIAQANNLRQIEEKKAQEELMVKMVDMAAHTIGLNNKKAYFRHGKYWYKPYRNHYCSGSQGDPVWEEMVQQGYAGANRGLGSTFYYLTRKGLDWLGERTNIKIHDPEE